jgi:hypothetical protein
MQNGFVAAGMAAVLVLGCSSQGSGSGAPEGVPSGSPSAAVSGATSGSAKPGAIVVPPGSTGAVAAEGTPRTLDRYAERLVWSPAGDRVAVWCAAACDPWPGGAPSPSAQPAHTINVVELPSGAARAVNVDTPGTTPPGFVSFSPKGTLLLAVIGDNVRAYRLPDFRSELTMGRLSSGEAFVASPDDAYVANLAGGTGLEVWDLAKHDIASMFVRYDLVPGSITWIPSGKRVIFAGPAVPPELWGLQNKRIARLNVDETTWTKPVVRVTSNGTVAIASGDGTVAIFDGESGKAKAVLRKPFKKGEPGKSVDGALSPDEKSFAVATDRGDLTIFDIASKKSSDLVLQAGTPRSRRTWTPDGAHVAFEQDGAVYLASTAGGAAPEKIGEGSLVGVSADGALLVRGANGVAAFAGGKERWRLPLPATGSGVALSGDRKVAALTDGRVRLVRIADGKAATLTLEPKDGKLSLVPQAGTAEADVKAVLGK